MPWRTYFVFITLFGILLRVFAALSRTDMVWPDEHFQALEPASAIVFGRAYMSWEWAEGYRSWFLPGLYIPILYLGKVAGLDGGKTLILLCRLFSVLASCTVIFSLNRVMSSFQLAPLARLLAVLTFTFSAPMILWAPTTLADNWSMLLSWFALAYTLSVKDLGSRKQWFVAGMLAGLAYLAKLQIVFWIVGLGLALLIARVSFRNLVNWTLGIFAIFLFGGILDKFTWGDFFHSTYVQVTSGVRIASTFGTLPWDAYFSLILKDLGPWLFAAIGILFLTVLIAKRKFPSFAHYQIVLVPWLFFFISHALIPHKETRFLLPMFPVFFFLFGVVLDAALKTFVSEQELEACFSFKTSFKTALATCFVLIALTSMVAFTMQNTPLEGSPFNVAELEDKIYRYQNFPPRGNRCVMMVDFPWAWSRGQLVIGERTDIVFSEYPYIADHQFKRCQFAILPNWQEAKLVNAPGNWKLFARSETPYSLFENTAAR